MFNTVAEDYFLLFFM